MSMTTIFLGKFLGLYLIAISIGMFVGRRRTPAVLLCLDGRPLALGLWMTLDAFGG
jgi:cadmium resistance protein CadD (predicted permease)